jgi:cytochrome c
VTSAHPGAFFSPAADAAGAQFSAPETDTSDVTAGRDGLPLHQQPRGFGMNTIRRLTVMGLAAACFSLSAAAQERGTKDEAKAMVDAAFEHIKKVGAEKAYKDFNTDKATWTRKDLYVIAQDDKAVFLVHGTNEKLVGKDMSAALDGSGKPLSAGLIALAAKGGGWYDYDWPDPITKKMMAKTTYVRKPPTGGGFIGVGVYR